MLQKKKVVRCEINLVDIAEKGITIATLVKNI